MTTYNVIIDDMIEGTTKSELEPEVGDWVSARYYNDVGDVRWADGVVTDVLGED